MAGFGATVFEKSVSSLSNELLRVLDTLPSSKIEESSSECRRSIQTYADALDSIVHETYNGSSVKRAELATKACKLLFNNRVHTPDQDPYKKSQQAYCTASGVVIDLEGLNSIILSPECDVATVGTGAKWDNVYEELEKYGLTVVGGRVSGVGVGGLILGGKFHLSRKKK
ncbi:MAG: hypothetical protein M1820_001857 [Bogoriella megaspora]|nr:MAG: hypothetical protein M1820_001857 [Bogoriella megaspora]